PPVGVCPLLARLGHLLVPGEGRDEGRRRATGRVLGRVAHHLRARETLLGAVTNVGEGGSRRADTDSHDGGGKGEGKATHVIPTFCLKSSVALQPVLRSEPRKRSVSGEDKFLGFP